MSAHQVSAYPAIALQLSATLDSYALAIERMVARPAQLEHHRECGELMDRLRLYVSSLPSLSAQHVELLIRHFELTHAVWQLQAGRRSRAEVVQLHETHKLAVEALRVRCAGLMAAG